MPDPYEIVAEINAFLVSQRPKTTQELSDLAAAYASLCKEANTRLLRCADYLRRGLRSEAIYHSEVEPDLLDWVGVLDMVPGPAWRTVCDQHNLETAPSLHMDIARELNAAYTTEEASRHTLKNLRRMSLAGASVRERLAAMRSLATIDPTNTQLDQDIKEFEAARLREIVNESREAYDACDPEQLGALLKEVSGNGWRVKPPADFVASLSKSAKHVARDLTAERLESLLPDLHNAYSAFSYEECKALLDEWNRIVSKTKISVPQRLAVQVQPIIEWVAGVEREREIQQRFADACARLSDAIDRAAPAHELQVFYDHVASFGLQMPEGLEQRCRQRVMQLASRRRRRVRLTLVLSGVGLLIVAGLVVLLIYNAMVSQQVDALESRVRSLLDARKIDEAEKALAAAPADLLEQPRVQAQVNRLADIKGTLQQKVAEFREHMRRAGAGGVESPDTESLSMAKGVGRELAGYGIGDPLTEALEFEDRLTRYRLTEQGRSDAEFQTAADRVEEGSKALDDRPIKESIPADVEPDELAQFRQKLTSFQGKLTELEDAVGKLKEFSPSAPLPQVSEKLKQERLDRLGKVLISSRKAASDRASLIVDRQGQLTAVSNLGLQARSAQDLEKALKDYVARYDSNSPRRDDFAKAAQQAGLWTAVDDWAKLLAKWGSDLLPDGKTELAARLEDANAYLQSHPTTPFKDALGKYLDYLTKAQASLDDKGPWKGRFKSTIGMLPMKFLVLTGTDGERYYTLQGITKAASQGSLVYVLTDMKVETPADTADANFFREMRFLKDPPPFKPAPQAEIARKVGSRIDELKLHAALWDTVGFDIAQAIKDANDTDVIYRCYLLNLVMDHLGNSAWIPDPDVQKSVESHIFADAAQLTGWVDPKDTASRNARPAHEEKLGRMDFLAMKQKIIAERKRMCQALMFQCFDCRGVPIRTKDGGWRLLTSSDPPKDTELWAVVSGKVQKVGQIQAGQVRITEPSLTEGALIFLRPATPSE
jgi:hypothetical protein